jgi:hypothetical protein
MYVFKFGLYIIIYVKKKPAEMHTSLNHLLIIIEQSG